MNVRQRDFLMVWWKQKKAHCWAGNWWNHDCRGSDGGLLAMATSLGRTEDVMLPNFKIEDVSRSVCEELTKRRRLLGAMLTIWIAYDIEEVGENRAGSCGTFLRREPIRK